MVKIYIKNESDDRNENFLDITIVTFRERLKYILNGLLLDEKFTFFFLNKKRGYT